MVVKHELSRIVELGELALGSLAIDLVAEPSECDAVARRLGLLAVASLRAQGVVEAAGRGAVRVRGTLVAELTQECVVTLEPIPARVEAEFDRLFVRSEEAGHLVVLDPEGPDQEPLVGDRLDVGELVVEELALALNPYPRSAEADAWLARFGRAGPEERDASASPFARLARAVDKD
jgi:uncharacterized metal-binding protein YceD (DUF177 family)